MLNYDSFLLCAIGGGIFDLLKIHKQENKQQHFSILVEAIQLVNLTHTLEKGKINYATIFRGLKTHDLISFGGYTNNRGAVHALCTER